MKKVSALSGLLLKTLAVFALLIAAGVAGVGIAALFAFRDVGGLHTAASRTVQATAQDDEATTPRVISLSRIERWQGQSIAMNVDASLSANRFVAAEASDRPQFTYADNESAPVPAPIVAATTVAEPAALEEAAPVKRSQVPRLTDPGSHFIVDDNTGRIIGIDGTSGALSEARQAATQLPHPAREVRAALPVDAVIPSDLPPPKPNLYPAIRRAMPIDETADSAPEQPQAFNAANELADDEKPVLRAQPVTISQPAKAQRRPFSIF